MVKAGRPEELFSELFIYKLGKLMGFPMAEYQPDGDFIRSRDFTDGATVNFEPAAAVIGEESDYIKIYEALRPYGKDVCALYVQQCYLDALVFNMDRHEHNFGLLRTSDTGKVLGMAPFFAHNIALISRGYPKNFKAENDRLIADFALLLKHTGLPLSVRKLTRQEIGQCITKMPWELPVTGDVPDPKRFVAEYLLNRQAQLEERCRGELSVVAN
jgi:hypothetical protein